MRYKERLVLFELNEFSIELLEQAVKRFNLPHIARILEYERSDTFTEDTYDSNWLEPWVQWVSVHTGKNSASHNIKHLGDVPHLNSRQVWESLSDHGVSSGVWGAMNASRAHAGNVAFFFPDPWVFSERAYPEELNDLLDLPRYLSKNYLNIDWPHALRLSLRFLKFVAKPSLLWQIRRHMGRMLANVVKFKDAHFNFICFADYLATMMFVRLYKQHQTQFSVLFINSLAHLQHHHWRSGELSQLPEMAEGLWWIDECLGLVMNELEQDTKLLVFNALSQKNTGDEPPWFLYRQKDHELFLKETGVKFRSVEPHMTYDAHVFFDSRADLKTAVKTLSEAHVGGSRVFLVETYGDDTLKLFYRIDFNRDVAAGERFTIDSKNFDFYSLFEKVVQRTGKHIPHGVILSSAPLFPKRLANHEVASYIEKHFIPSEVQVRHS